MKSTIVILAFLTFFASSALAQDQTQSQTPLDSPPQGWYKQQSGTTTNLRHVFFFTKDSGWVTGGSSLYHTENGGATWIANTTLPAGWIPFLFLDYSTGFAATADSIIKTTDAGISWSKSCLLYTSPSPRD